MGDLGLDGGGAECVGGEVEEGFGLVPGGEGVGLFAVSEEGVAEGFAAVGFGGGVVGAAG